MGLRWVSWVFKNYELGLAGLAGFEKIKVGFLGFYYIIIESVSIGF